MESITLPSNCGHSDAIPVLLQWVQGKMTGAGTRWYWNGAVYTYAHPLLLVPCLGSRNVNGLTLSGCRGDLIDGARHGRGLHVYTNGDVYDGSVCSLDCTVTSHSLQSLVTVLGSVLPQLNTLQS